MTITGIVLRIEYFANPPDQGQESVLRLNIKIGAIAPHKCIPTPV